MTPSTVTAPKRPKTNAATTPRPGGFAGNLLRVDLSRREITIDGKTIHLTPNEFKLLSVFVRHPRQVLSREQLLQLVWGDAYGVSGDQVKLYVGYLRRKLDPDEPGNVPIETVRGFGYRYKPAS